ncbi:UNVERIFIED_CONTAM: hypothetical protein FKN15_026577 [Acipenser sinensis]
MRPIAWRLLVRVQAIPLPTMDRSSQGAAYNERRPGPRYMRISVGSGIAWTRASNLQAIGHILHSTRSAFTECATREPPETLKR